MKRRELISRGMKEQIEEHIDEEDLREREWDWGECNWQPEIEDWAWEAQGWQGEEGNKQNEKFERNRCEGRQSKLEEYWKAQKHQSGIREEIEKYEDLSENHNFDEEVLASTDLIEEGINDFNIEAESGSYEKKWSESDTQGNDPKMSEKGAPETTQSSDVSNYQRWKDKFGKIQEQMTYVVTILWKAFGPL